MDIYLIRHGESIGNTKQGYISGRSDTQGLTLKGKTQIIRSIWELKKSSINTVITSPVARALETAEYLNRYFHARLIRNSNISELNYGNFEGNYWWKIVRSYPDFDWRKTQTNIDYPYPGGESFRSVYERVKEFYRSLGEYETHDSIAVISHQLVLATLLYCVSSHNDIHNKSNINEQEYLRFIHHKQIPNGLVARIKLDKNAVQFVQEYPSLHVVEPNKQSVSFYLNQHSIETPLLRTIETASKNKVFLNRTGKKSIVKVLSDTEAVRSARLIKLYDYLSSHNTVLVPRILFSDNSRDFFGNTCVNMEFVSGTDLYATLLKTQDTNKLLKKVFATVLRVHSVPVRDVSEFWYPDDWTEGLKTSWKYYMRVEIQKTIHCMRKFEFGNHVNRELRNLLIYIENQKDEENVPLHGDINTSNIIFSKNKTVYFIDFERARIGDALWDFAYLDGDLSIKNKDASISWRKVYFAQLSLEKRRRAMQYILLFHAWTVRDMADYKDDAKRRKEGKISEHILKSFKSEIR